MRMEVLGPEPSGRRRWLQVLAGWPTPEPFAHPTFVELFAPLCAPRPTPLDDADLALGDGGTAGARFGGHCTRHASCDAAEARLAVLSLDDGTVALPFTLQRNALGADVVGAYGYGGAFTWGVEPPVAAFWAEFDAWCRSAGVVSEFHRLHLFDDVIAPFPDGVRVRSTNVVCDLRPEWDAIWADVDRSVRKNVRRAESQGVRVEVDRGTRLLPDLARIYASTMQRREAHERYRFPEETFDRLADELADHVVVAAASHGSVVVAAELLLLSGTRLFSFLGGSDVDAYALRPNDLVKVELMRWGRAHGVTDLVLGGGHRPGDGIERFKRRFAPTGIVPFRTAERIHDVDAYAALSAGLDDAIEHFPRYRAPAAVAQ